MPANDRAPSFQFYPRDFMADRAVSAMTPEELGGYILLMCHAWESDGKLPNDDEMLARLSRLGDRWPACERMVRAAFLNEGDHLLQKRMAQERKAQALRHEQARKGGLASASRARDSLGRLEKGVQLSTKTPSTPASSFALESNSKHLRLSGANAHFDAFWNAWPKGRKKSKQAALKAWKRLKPTETLIHRIMAGLAEGKASKEWQELKFIPYPATWLNSGGWDDDYEPLVQSVVAGPSFLDQTRSLIANNVKLNVRAKAEIETIAATIHKKNPGWLADHVVQLAVNLYWRKCGVVDLDGDG